MAEENINSPENIFSYFCTNCRQRYKTSKRLFTEVSYLGSTFTCIKCGKEFQTGFKSEKDAHNDSLPYRCGDCGIKFINSTLLLHHSYEHSNQWPHRCPYCQKGFAMQSLLRKHMVQRDNVCIFRCMQCSKVFHGMICNTLLLQLDFQPYCERCSNGSSGIEYVTT